MNYRHAYHAGNFADVVKHAVLVLLLRALRAKDKPFAVLDTHAGTGRYDLSSAAAQKTGEYRDGIARLLAAAVPPPLAVPYLDLVRAANAGRAELAVYPGSPLLARALLRPGDRLVPVELHPEDAATLRALFRGDPQVAVHRRDGYEALKALLPPSERRGLVLIDPPFEAADEAERLIAGLRAAAARWPGGIYAVWYPIKARAPVERFHAGLAMTGLRRLLLAELTVFAAEHPDRLNGCGLVLVNPPWRLDEQLRALLPGLQPVLARDGGRWRLDWLVPE